MLAHEPPKAKRRRWTQPELELLRWGFADSRTDDLARALARSYSTVAQKAARLGLSKSQEYLTSTEAHRFDGRKGMGTRFAPGQVPWNKGVPGICGTHPRCRATQFKPGRLPHEARNYLPIGAVRVTVDGHLERKVTDDQAIVPARRWTPVHRLVWEAANGPVPVACVIRFRPGMHTAELGLITLDRLECISRAEHLRRNSIHQYGPEWSVVVQLRGAITRQLNKRIKDST